MATVHLPSYINKNVKVTYRNGGRYTGKLTYHSERLVHPYTLNGRTYTFDGFYYSEDECYPYDIVSIRSMEGTKYAHLEEQVAELQAEIERLKKEEEAEKPKLPERFRRQYALKLLDGEVTRTNVDKMCTWSSTPQGHGFWDRIGGGCGAGAPKLTEEAIKYLQEMVILSYRQLHGD